MLPRHHLATVIVGIALGGGSVGLLASSHAPARAADQKNAMSNADYARDASDHLRKAHEDVDHLVNSKTDRKAPGYADAYEARKAIDRASKALDRYVTSAAPAPAN
jgi:hypothetical protein